MKFSDFTQITRERIVETLEIETFTALLELAAKELTQSVRLLGVGVRFAEANCPQLQLF